MDRKLVFFTSDWHIGHSNVLKFDNRPFTDLNHMHRVLMNNFNACVPEGSVTYFLGDVGLCDAEIIKGVITKLHGAKVLILGNHDRNSNFMYKLGFDAVMYGAVLQIADERVTLSHCPLKGIQREDTKGMNGAKPGEHWHGETKNGRFTTENYGQFHLHGHIHSPNGGKSVKVLGRQRDVGVAANNYRPVSLSEIESWITKTKQKEKKQL